VNVVVALVTPEPAAVKMTEAPVVSMSVQPAKVTTPLAAASGLAEVQESVPAFTDNVTGRLLVVTVFPKMSWTTTTGCAVNAVPLGVVAGVDEKLKLLAAAGVIVNAGVLVADVRPLEVAVTT
jgi:hypothetical protein